MKGLDVRGVVALMITMTLGIAVVVGIVGVALSGRPLSDQGAHLLSTICGAMIGVLSMIVADKVSKPQDEAP